MISSIKFIIGSLVELAAICILATAILFLWCSDVIKGVAYHIEHFACWIAGEKNSKYWTEEHKR